VDKPAHQQSHNEAGGSWLQRKREHVFPMELRFRTARVGHQVHQDEGELDCRGGQGGDEAGGDADRDAGAGAEGSV
jgi:hypothetical protein